MPVLDVDVSRSWPDRVRIDGPKLHFNRLDLVTEGAVSAMTGDIDFNNELQPGDNFALLLQAMDESATVPNQTELNELFEQLRAVTLDESTSLSVLVRPLGQRRRKQAWPARSSGVRGAPWAAT